MPPRLSSQRPNLTGPIYKLKGFLARPRDWAFLFSQVSQHRKKSGLWTIVTLSLPKTQEKPASLRQGEVTHNRHRLEPQSLQLRPLGSGSLGGVQTSLTQACSCPVHEAPALHAPCLRTPRTGSGSVHLFDPRPTDVAGKDDSDEVKTEAVG